MEFTVMMGRTMCLALFAAGLAGLFETAEAADWMFRRSYYSHDAEPADSDDAPPGRSVYREPWVAAHPHMAVRSGWRINSFVMHNGSSTDTTFYRENWTDVDY
jgi:hypothetical protein